MSSAPSTTAASARGAGAPSDAALPGHPEPAVARGPTVTVTVAADYTASAAEESAATSAPTLTTVTHEDASIGVEDEPPGLKILREAADNIVSSLSTDGNLSNRYKLPLQPRTTPPNHVTPLSTPSLHPSNDLPEFAEAQPTMTSMPLAVGSVTTLQPPQPLLHATMTSVENLPVVSVAASNSPTCARVIPSPGPQSTLLPSMSVLYDRRSPTLLSSCQQPTPSLPSMSVLYDRRSPTLLSSCQQPTPSLPTYTPSASTPETASAVQHILHHLSRIPSPLPDTAYNAPAVQFSSAHDSEDEKRLEIDLRPQDSQTQRGKKRSRSSCKTASNAAKTSPSETVIISAAVNENDSPNHKTLALDESDNVEQRDIASCIDIYDEAVAPTADIVPAIASVKRRRVGGTSRNVCPTRTLPRSARKTKPSPRTTISKRSRRSSPSSTAAATMSTSSLAASTAADVAEPSNMFWKKEIRNRSKAQPEDGAPATIADVDTAADDAQTANTIPVAASEPGPLTSPIPPAGSFNKLVDRYVLQLKHVIDIEDIHTRLISCHYRFMRLPPTEKKCRIMIRILARDLEKLERVATLFRRVMALLMILLRSRSSLEVAQQELQSRLNARIIELRTLLTINNGRLENRSLNPNERKLYADMRLTNIIVARSIIMPLKKYILEYLKEQFGVERKPVPQHKHWMDDYSRFYYVNQAISMITLKCRLYITHCKEMCLQLAHIQKSAPGTGTSRSRGGTQEGQDDQKSCHLPVENVSLPANGWELLPSKYWTRNKDGTYTFTLPKDPVATRKAEVLSPSSCMSSPSRFASACIGTRAYRHALHGKPHCTGATSPLDDPVRDDHHNTDNNNGDEATVEKKCSHPDDPVRDDHRNTDNNNGNEATLEKKCSHPDDLDCPADTEDCTSEEEQPIAEIVESHPNAEEHHDDDDVDKDSRDNDGEVEGDLSESSFCGRRVGDRDDVAADMQSGPELERPIARAAVYLEQPPSNVYNVVPGKSKPLSCIKQLLSHQTKMLCILENTGAPPQMTSNTCIWRPATTVDSSTSWSEVSPSCAECKQNSQYTSLERFLLSESFFSLSLVEQKLVFDDVSDPSTLFHRIETFLISRHRVYGHAVNRCNENQAALPRSTPAAQRSHHAQPQPDFANLVIL